MAFTDIFIRRPVLSICVNLLLLMAGLSALMVLNVRQYPRSDNAVVTVTTAYVGASADLVRGFITTPLERVIASADGIDYLDSSSQLGLSTIKAHLRLNFDVNDALTQIQAKVAQVRNDLPIEAQAPVFNVESADNRFAAMYLGFYSETMAQNQITDYLVRAVQPKLASVPGVEKADILGARTLAMRIWLKPERLAALNLSPREVSDALSRNNYLSALGATKGNMIRVNLQVNTNISSVEDFKNLVVRSENDAVVRLADIADITLGAESYDEDVRFDGQKATFMGIWALPNANSLDVITRVRAVLPDIERALPPSLKLGIPYDSTEYIRDSIKEVVSTLFETVLIVILVIFLFIGSFRAVLVPVVAIPLSLLGAVGLMVAFGFSLNLLTLLAIVLAVGLVVDDAIVVLENVERHVSEGMAPIPAAILSARELVVPVIAMTITLAAVYTPIAFQGGLTGTLFREFALTLAGAVVVSGFVALTLSPMMASRLVRHSDTPTKLQRGVSALFDRLRDRYRFRLRQIVNYKDVVLAVSLVIIIMIFPLYMFSTSELAPREDQGVVFGIVQGPPQSTLDQMQLFAKDAQKVFESFPEYRRSFQITGPNFGFSGMLPVPWSERSRTTLEMEAEAWGKVTPIAGIRVIITTPAPLPGGSDFPVELVISSTAPPEEIAEFAAQLVQTAFQSGLFMFADTDLKFNLPQSELIVDRDKVALLDLDLRSVGLDLGVYLGGDFINRFNLQGRSYKVIPQAKRVDRLNPEQVLDYHTKSRTGQLVPVSAFASLKHSVQPESLKRFQQLNSARIQGALPPGVSIDQALSVLEDQARQILPKSYSIDYAGESRQLRKEQSSLSLSIIAAMIVIFLVLASQFESFRDPLIIMIGSVPLALGGALIMVFLDFTTLNIYSQVGLVTLIGLVAKNGILIVEFANVVRERGVSKVEAVIEAAATRLRPVLMTSVATVVGHFPLVIASGPGSGARNSIGIVLVTGMVIGTIFTLAVVPVLYVVLGSEHHGSAPVPEHDSSSTVAVEESFA